MGQKHWAFFLHWVSPGSLSGCWLPHDIAPHPREHTPTLSRGRSPLLKLLVSYSSKSTGDVSNILR